MIGSSGSSFRKIIEMTAKGASALKKKESGKSSFKDIATKGKGSSGKRSFQVAIQHVVDTQEKKKKKKADDLKISESTSKKSKSKSNKGTNFSGTGDANL
tara:strand:+ start:464 stop:763 length:300 start_codon:yes stop_codon:yes gene_type:complete